MRVEECKRTMASNEIVFWFHAAVMTIKSQVRKTSNTIQVLWLMNFMSLLFVSKWFPLLSRIISFFQEAPKLNTDICQSESCEKMTLLKSLVRLIQSIWLGYGLWTAVVAGCCGYSSRNMINVYWGDEIITPSFCLVTQVGLPMMISLAISFRPSRGWTKGSYLIALHYGP